MRPFGEARKREAAYVEDGGREAVPARECDVLRKRPCRIERRAKAKVVQGVGSDPNGLRTRAGRPPAFEQLSVGCAVVLQHWHFSEKRGGKRDQIEKASAPKLSYAVESFRAEAVEAAPAVEVVGGKDRTRGPLVTPKWHLMPPQEPAQNIVARCPGPA